MEVQSFVNIVIFSTVAGLTVTSPLQKRIVGGNDVAPGTAPYQVALYFNGSFFCGATLIGQRTALTAAQCIDGHEHHASLYSLYYGSLEHVTGHPMRIKRILKHPQFTYKKIEFDLAVLHLEGNVQLSGDSFPIALSERPPMVGTLVSISGWGTLQPDGQFPETLQMATTMRVLPVEVCKRQWGHLFQITDGLICAESPHQSACHWDSGGPVTQNGLLVGVISFGSKHCLEHGKPNGYADVAHHRKWILESMLV